ncbi:hypothetical protein NDU88_004779 [Pleurodeles waltl]|uniref:Uncharacterized protein n=1 Tax=Pleurodeles waltl TaxID=8319 RepID=A0AAV7L5M1_PLEWA|nr:hypothetical protein NDU88_004779 [Pleurodeles waltl]
MSGSGFSCIPLTVTPQARQPLEITAGRIDPDRDERKRFLMHADNGASGEVPIRYSWHRKIENAALMKNKRSLRGIGPDRDERKRILMHPLNSNVSVMARHRLRGSAVALCTHDHPTAVVHSCDDVTEYLRYIETSNDSVMARHWCEQLHSIRAQGYKPSKAAQPKMFNSVRVRITD